MQTLDPELSSQLRRALGADETLLHRFAAAAGDLAVNLVVAAVILAVTFWASRWADRLVRRVLGRVNRLGPPDVTLQTFGGSLARYGVIVVGLIAVLQQVGVQATSILAVLGAASLAIGLALQGALSNVAAGVMLLLFRPYRVGDVVEIAGRTGVVRALDLFVTELATFDNVKVVLPNGKVFGDVIVNNSFHPQRRADVVVRLDVDADVGAVLEGLKARALANPRVLRSPEPIVEIVAISETYVQVAVRAWAVQADFPAVKADLMLAARALSLGASLPPPPEPPTVTGPLDRPPRRRRLRGPAPET
ncbi:MAG: mechanosensitive ion channel family protein [Phenylobacterium sp.]|uniref:mechanosensitive ion channel family protein n=1 Tax=Phenylobacterium sp. TaxID=1871053 RepID=UPI0039187D63